MVAHEERELLLQSLKGYLEELRESGVDELPFGAEAAPAVKAASAAQSAQSAQPAQASQAASVSNAPQTGLAGCQGVGNMRARLLFVMRGSGFAGEAGELLAKIVQAMGFATSDVYLLSFPGGAALPLREAVLQGIREVAPRVVVALGEEAAQLLLESREPVQNLRGRFHNVDGLQLMPTLHPELLVASPALKRDVWNEMQQVMRLLASP